MKKVDDKKHIKELSSLRRKPVDTSTDQLIQENVIDAQKRLPLFVQPTIDGVDLNDWASRNRSFITERLVKYGGIVFRHFNMAGLDDFTSFMKNVSSDLMEYHEGASPRTQISDNVYTSTDYPPDHRIFLHNELSYRHTFPSKIFFWCITPAEQGGQTPIADVRKVFQRISPLVREKFSQKGWMLVRNFGDGFGLSWQNVFHTTAKDEVEEYCQRSGIHFEWKKDNRLRIQQIRPAIAKYSNTDEMVWFNHVAFFHVASLEVSIREALLAEFKDEDLPTNTYYGDGTPIEASVLEEIFHAYNEETVSFLWKKGDVMLLDNVLVAHGRAPFTGERKVLVGMSDPISWDKMQV